VKKNARKNLTPIHTVAVHRLQFHGQIRGLISQVFMAVIFDFNLSQVSLHKQFGTGIYLLSKFRQVQRQYFAPALVVVPIAGS
jgi:hypothetical protein